MLSEDPCHIDTDTNKSKELTNFPLNGCIANVDSKNLHKAFCDNCNCLLKKPGKVPNLDASSFSLNTGHILATMAPREHI